MKTSELTGAALNWAVAEAAGYKPSVYSTQSIRAELPTGGVIAPFMPGFRWDQAGPIIEREGISTAKDGDGHWRAGEYLKTLHHYGSTPLVAAMRCYVASKLGDEVKIPEGLK